MLELLLCNIFIHHPDDGVERILSKWTEETNGGGGWIQQMVVLLFRATLDKLEKWADRNPLKRVWQREMPSRAAGGKDPMHTPAHAEGCLAGKHIQGAGPGCPGGQQVEHS